MSPDAYAEVSALLRGSPTQPDASRADDLVTYARTHGVHLLLAERWSLPALTADLRAAAALDAAREAELRRVTGALASAGIRGVLIKGAALAYTHYPRPELRPRIDTDLLIPESARVQTTAALQAIGYVRPTETDGDLIVSQFHFTRRERPGIEHALDIHWRISNVIAFACVLSYDEIAREAVPLRAAGPHAFGPSAAHSLIIACVHRVAHHADSLHLLWLYDIHLLANSLDVREQARVAELAAARRVRAVCTVSLQHAARAFGGVSADLAARIAPPPGTREPTTAFLEDRLRLVDVLTADLKALDRWADRLRLLGEHAFPSREYMFARYGTRRTLLLPWLYLRRMVAGAPKWFRS